MMKTCAKCVKQLVCHARDKSYVIAYSPQMGSCKALFNKLDSTLADYCMEYNETPTTESEEP